MHRTTMALSLAAFITGAALGALALKSTLHSSNGSNVEVSGKASVGGPFELVDQTGKTRTDKDFAGRYLLVFFGYTNCPDICPAGLQVMTVALDKLGHRADDLVPIFITLDPERDTPERLAAYVKSFTPRLVALTGSEKQTNAAAKAYRVFYQKVPDDKDPKRYSLDHSAIFYLMGKDGTLLAPIPHTTDVNELVAAIDSALP